LRDLGLLDVETVLGSEKRLEHVSGEALDAPFEGYLSTWARRPALIGHGLSRGSPMDVRMVR
jgi:hypothetical protein